MFTRLGYAALAAFLVAAGCGPSDSRKADIRFQANSGDAYKIQYKLESHYEIDPGDGTPMTHEQMSLSQVKSYKCTKTDGGKGTWVVKTEEISGTGTGSMESQAYRLIENQKDKSETFTRDSQNKLSTLALSSPLDPVYPNRPVSVGDQWRSEVTIQGINVLVTHTFEGFEKVNGKETAIINSNPGHASVTVIKPIRTWVEISNGWPLKAEGTLEVNSQGDVKTTTTMSLARM